MKKTMIVLLTLLVCTSVFAASKISFTVTPMTWQNFSISLKDVKNLDSFYGFGGNVEFRILENNGLTFGLKTSFDDYLIKNKSNFANIDVLAEAGYTAHLTAETDLIALAEFGISTQIYDKESSYVYAFGAEIGATYKLNSKITTLYTLEGLLSVAQADGINYTNFRLIPSVGLEFDL